MELSELDKKIINVLLEDSRQSYRQIAKKVKSSVATVMNHIKKLESEKVIKGYTADINYEKAGYDVSVIIDIRINKGKLIQVEKKISTHPNVSVVYDHTGTFDASLIARFKSTRAMDNFLKEIQSYDFVERTETRLILATLSEQRVKV